MSRPLLFDPASEGGGVGVLAEAEPDASERALAPARLGGHVAGAIELDDEAAPESPGAKMVAGEGRT